jgi:hypothetical protein
MTEQSYQERVCGSFERTEKLPGYPGNLLYRRIEGGLIHPGRFVEATDLPDKPEIRRRKYWNVPGLSRREAGPSHRCLGRTKKGCLLFSGSQRELESREGPLSSLFEAIGPMWFLFLRLGAGGMDDIDFVI